MFYPLSLECKVNRLLRIVDIYGYTNSDKDTANLASLLIICGIVQKAEKLGAKAIQEDRVHLKAFPNKTGISVSLIFRDTRSIEKFLSESFFK